MYEPGARRLTSETPGATRSGPRLPLPLLPRLEKDATVSSSVSLVPWVSRLPTASTSGSNAGLASPPSFVVPLPAETTTTMPLSHATSAACASGSRR